MFRAFLNDIILKARRNSVNRPAHETEVHDVMETVDAIDFVTSGVLFRAVNLECAQGLSSGRLLGGYRIISPLKS